MGLKRRHFTSKSYTKEESSSSSEELDSSDEEQQQQQQQRPHKQKTPRVSTTATTSLSSTQQLYKVVPIDKTRISETVPDKPEGVEAEGSGSSEDDESESESDSDSDTDSSSEEENMSTMKPVFVSRRNKKPTAAAPSSEAKSQKEITIKKLEHNILVSMKEEQAKLKEASAGEREELGGVDDTDNLDPDLEYEEWKERELARIKALREKLILKEEEEEETYRRREEYDQQVS